jgi:preprotein translocase subunit SecY
MSYQPRLDQLEAEVFQTAAPTTVNYSSVLPYVIICVASLISLYTFCPRVLQTRKNRQYQIRIDRFLSVWLVLSFVICFAYYSFSRNKPAISTE